VVFFTRGNKYNFASFFFFFLKLSSSSLLWNLTKCFGDNLELGEEDHGFDFVTSNSFLCAQSEGRLMDVKQLAVQTLVKQKNIPLRTNILSTDNS
jgi:hypothetical protein